MSLTFRLLCIPVFLLMACIMTLPATAATEQTLARDGKAALPIVISPAASEDTAALAQQLKFYLDKITGGSFDIQKGDGSTGIALGTLAEFGSLKLDVPFSAEHPEQTEDYLIRSHDKGVYLVGATEKAVPHAMWDLLYRLGYRQFFPGANWEIIPTNASPSISVDEHEHPDYLARRIWYGFGNWPDVKDNYNKWNERNRMAQGLNVAMGHAWDTIYKNLRAEFDAHPEYLVSQRPVKFRIGNPDLRKMIADYAVRQFDSNPKRQSISLDPSDGGGWEDAEEEKIFKSVSDRVVTLANEVAEAVTAKYPDKYIGFYAYHMHSPPPSIQVHPNIVVGVATSFIKGGYTVDQLMEGWSKMGAKLGMREYYSVVISHKERPGGPPASDLNRLISNTRRYHKNGARLMSAEASDSWGTAGLSFYIASRLMWDVDADTDALVNDFYEKAFGEAQQPMREFYKYLDRGNRPLFSRDMIGRMYRHLNDAYSKTNDPGVISRLDDLALYTRYVELLWELQEGSDRMEGTKNALSHAYRIRDRHMVHSYAMWRDTRGGGYARPEGDNRWNIPEGQNPWKSSEPFTAEEIQGYISKGIENNPITTFTPVSFSDELVPAAKALGITDTKKLNHGYVRGNMTVYLWLDKPGSITFTGTSGQIGGAHETAKVKLTLFAVEDPTFEASSTGEIAIDKEAHDVTLSSNFKGLHRLEVTNAGRGIALQWPDGLPVAIPSSGEEPTLLRHRTYTYFYVPKGTRRIGGYNGGFGGVLDGDGNKVTQLTDRGYFDIPVPPGQDGKVWQFHNAGGTKLLMTVPPYLFRSPVEIMLPREVVEADARR